MGEKEKKEKKDKEEKKKKKEEKATVRSAPDGSDNNIYRWRPVIVHFLTIPGSSFSELTIGGKMFWLFFP